MNKETLDQLVKQSARTESAANKYTPYGRGWYVIQVLDGYNNGQSYDDHDADETVVEQYGPYSKLEVFEILQEAFLIPTELMLVLRSFEYYLYRGPYFVDHQYKEGAKWRKLVVKLIDNKPKEEWVRYAQRAKTESIERHLKLVRQQIGETYSSKWCTMEETEKLQAKEAELLLSLAKEQKGS